MLFPTIYGENLFDDLDDFFDMEPRQVQRRDPLYGKNASRIMKTDIRETDKAFELDIDLPGFKKEDIQAHLKDGYLTISAQKQVEHDDKDQKSGRYIRRERFSGSCSRSFYVGESVKEEDIEAKFENGILQLSIPKKAPEVPVQKQIMIK
ncbi:MAG TPA: Hsp20/alpha crystallin family protein [Candidatus Aphodousia gallistercoris]|nr:Hsp20/alpha crystallin family protein [Candidatus Aphodousia gallistercoris]